MMDNRVIVAWEEAGYACSTCLDVYAINGNKAPTVICENLHNLCLECFQKYQERNSSCGECRKPLRKGAPQKNISITQAMENIAKIINKAPALPALPSAMVNPVRMDMQPTHHAETPNTFHVATFCESSWNHKNIQNEVAAMLPRVIETMGWDGADLQKEYSETRPEQWVLFIDKNSKESKGFSKIVQSAGQFEMHWTGIVERNPNLYFEFYKKLFLRAQQDKDTLLSDMPQLVTTFTMPNSAPNSVDDLLYSYITPELIRHRIDISLTRVKKPWGFQKKLTAYLFPRENQQIQPFVLDASKAIVTHTTFAESIKPELDELMAKGLTTLFRAMSMDKLYPGEHERFLEKGFRDRPEDFFIYMIENRVRGLVHFTSDTMHLKRALVVDQCRLLPDAHKYADHFIQEFRKWALSAPSIAKNTPAIELRFPYVQECNSAVREAINRSSSV